jgi:hypothetical protein
VARWVEIAVDRDGEGIEADPEASCLKCSARLILRRRRVPDDETWF